MTVAYIAAPGGIATGSATSGSGIGPTVNTITADISQFAVGMLGAGKIVAGLKLIPKVAAGAEAIGNAGQLNGGTYVTTPNQIPAGATAGQVEGLLEIGPGKGANSITATTPKSNLATPANGATTSGGAVQYQLKQPVKIEPQE